MFNLQKFNKENKERIDLELENLRREIDIYKLPEQIIEDGEVLEGTALIKADPTFYPVQLTIDAKAGTIKAQYRTAEKEIRFEKVWARELFKLIEGRNNNKQLINA